MFTPPVHWGGGRRQSPFNPLAMDCTDQDEPRGPRTGVRLAACLLGALILLYHAQNALADAVTGSAGNDEVSLQWEYDLEQGTGQVTILNLAVPIDIQDEECLYLVGLVPPNATVQCDPSRVAVNPCSGAVPPLPYLFARLPIGADVTITFQVPIDQQEHELVVTDSEYGMGFHLSSVGCFTFPKGTLNNFVAVRPIETRPAADLDKDGDVDLQDFAIFGQEFTGPQEP